MTLTNVLWASGWVIWTLLCTSKCDYSGACIGLSLSSQPPRPWPALTALAAQESSIRLTGGLGWALALLQAARPHHQEIRGSDFSPSQCQGCGCGSVPSDPALFLCRLEPSHCILRAASLGMGKKLLVPATEQILLG